MAKIIAIANQKGGVGKTTTSINLAAALSEKNKKVLAIDIDPQANLTSGYGINKYDKNKSIYDLLTTDIFAKNCIIEKMLTNLDIIPSNINLSGIELELIDKQGREYILRDKIKTIKDKYDYIIIDCPPALSLLTVNVLSASDRVLIPIQCEYYALEGLSQMIDTIELIQKGLNNNLKIDGVVFTMYDARNNLSKQVVDSVKDCLDEYIYDVLIPRNVRLAEAPSYGMPITEYDSLSVGAKSYRQLADELIAKDI